MEPNLQGDDRLQGKIVANTSRSCGRRETEPIAPWHVGLQIMVNPRKWVYHCVKCCGSGQVLPIANFSSKQIRTNGLERRCRACISIDAENRAKAHDASAAVGDEDDELDELQEGALMQQEPQPVRRQLPPLVRQSPPRPASNPTPRMPGRSPVRESETLFVARHARC